MKRNLKLIQAIFEHVWVAIERRSLDEHYIPKVIVLLQYAFYGGL